MEAVIGEPISVRDSLFRGKIQGNFCRLRPKRGMQPRITEQIESVSSNSLRLETVNFADSTGNRPKRNKETYELPPAILLKRDA